MANIMCINVKKLKGKYTHTIFCHNVNKQIIIKQETEATAGRLDSFMKGWGEI
jgi:hypothetical protein